MIQNTIHAGEYQGLAIGTGRSVGCLREVQAELVRAALRNAGLTPDDVLNARPLEALRSAAPDARVIELPRHGGQAALGVEALAAGEVHL